MNQKDLFSCELGLTQGQVESSSDGYKERSDFVGLRKNIRRLIQDVRNRSASSAEFDFSLFAWLLDRPPGPAFPTAATEGSEADDAVLVQRVMAAYKKANSEHTQTNSYWDTSIFKINADVHAALSGHDEEHAASILRNPANNAHFWGFDSITIAPPGKTEPHQDMLERLDPTSDWKANFELWNQDKLISLAEAIGAKKLRNPESPRTQPHLSPDQILDQIEAKMGIKIEFPMPYKGERGIKTNRGVASFRALQALYQAWRITQISGNKRPFRVLEIGAGLGRTAHFAKKLGIDDYTLIDLPLTGAAQGYFLGRTLGADLVSLHGEEDTKPVKIVPAANLAELNENFDLIVNVDSMTEMAPETMRSYWKYISNSGAQFLSINHDENELSISDIYNKSKAISITRHPYWMRRGYTEELITFN